MKDGMTRTIRYFYDNEDIVFDYDENGTIGNRYTHGPGIDEPLFVTNESGTYYYHADGLGSITALTDADQRVVQEYEYDAFGNLHDEKNAVKQPYSYTGREWDKEIKLYYYRARYYDAEVGRFLSEDPFPGVLTESQTLNGYPYVRNNPIIFVDPFGLYWEYSQSTRQLTYVDNKSGTRTPIGTGYSGQGAGLNNPNMQNVPNVGPIPQGTYDIGEPTSNRGPLTFPLTPQSGTNTFGRDAFLIHGDNSCRCQSASQGCVILDRPLREQINNSQDRELRVVP